MERICEEGGEKTRNDGRKEEGNEREERLIIRRKNRYCKEEEDGGRKDKKRVQESKEKNCNPEGKNANSCLYMYVCSGTGMKTVEDSSENFSVFKCHIRSHCIVSL